MRQRLNGLVPGRTRLGGFAVTATAACVAALLLTAAPSLAGGPHHGRTSGGRPGGHLVLTHRNWDGGKVGLQPGKIKHVWLIILENKSYDATFTGLNDNTYLWKSLPGQGVLLKNYYGTGHFSQDNYTSMVSGQAPQTDLQADCPNYTQATGPVDTSGTARTNPNYGQWTSSVGPNAKPGANGCVYPKGVPTLFSQLDKARVSWKGYAQDLNNPDTSGPAHSAGTQYCGAPYATAAKPDVNAPTPGPQPNPGSANATDQYVPKHFPFPWFQSVLQSGDCNAQHIANQFDPDNGLYHDLQSEATTPAFSWISPNNCSDAHDAVCRGNNLSGGFSDPNTPKPPVNYTGGLYAADLYLEHVIPEIEASPAFKDGGLIDVTFDEGFPPFTYSGNSFRNSKKVPANVQTSLATDSAGETLYGHTVRAEPTGPNTPLARDGSGNELYPGPGYNAYVDRPDSCVAQTFPSLPASTCLLGGGNHVPAARADKASAPQGSTTIDDNAAVATDVGRGVTGNGIPSGAYVGKVYDTPVTATASADNGGIVDTGLFELVDSQGYPLATSGPVSGVTLAAETPSSDPLYSSTGATTGGGDTGSVLISPYIHPGTVSKVFYNHYSWLATMEDLFAVDKSSPGIDGAGHLGYAAQPGLAPFGRDVFNAPNGQSSYVSRRAG